MMHCPLYVGREICKNKEKVWTTGAIYITVNLSVSAAKSELKKHKVI